MPPTPLMPLMPPNPRTPSPARAPEATRRRRLVALAALTLAAAVMATGCAADGRASRGGSGALDVQTRELPAGSFAAAWQAELNLGGGEVKDISRLDDLIVVTADNNRAVAVSAEGGTQRFNRPVVASQESMQPPVRVEVGGPTDREEAIAFPSVANLVVLDLSGREVAVTRLDYAFTSPATYGGGLMYAGVATDRGGQLAAVEPAAAALPLRYRKLLVGPVQGRPAYYEDVVYVATGALPDGEGLVAAVDAEREALWNRYGSPYFTTFGGNTADLAVDDFGLYVASEDTSLYVLDRLTGKPKWQYYAGQPLRDAPVPTADRVYQHVPGTGLVALAKTEGDNPRQPLWAAPGVTRFLSEDAQNVYGLADGRVVALDRQTGEVSFASDRRDFAFGVADPQTRGVFVVTRGGLLVHVEPVLKPGRVGVGV